MTTLRILWHQLCRHTVQVYYAMRAGWTYHCSCGTEWAR